MTWRERRDEKAALRRFELQWSRTWPDLSHAFSAYDGGLLVGRVFQLMHEPADKQWHWTMRAFIDNRQGSGTGVAEQRDTACLAVERAYRRFRQRIAGGEAD